MKKLLMVLIVIIMALSVGCSYQKEPILIWYNEEVEIPTNEHILMLDVGSGNFGLVSDDEDYFVGASWKVYYDGCVEYEEEYNLSGIVNKKEWVLDEEEMTQLYQLLCGSFKQYDEELYLEVDGMCYAFDFLDINGEVIHTCSGSIYGYETFDAIVDIIKPEDDIVILQGRR